MEPVIRYLDSIKKNNDEFTKSVINQFRTKGEKSLSNRQIEILSDKYIQHKQLVKHFGQKKEFSEFEKSLKDFFEKNGFLTKKQEAALFKKKK